MNANRTENENKMAAIYARNYNLIEFAGSDNHCAAKQEDLAGICCEKAICSVEDFISKVKGNETKIFTLRNE